MKKLIRLTLAFLPLLAFSKVPTQVVEQRYISVLAKSFNSSKFSAPRSPVFWSLCLGETAELSKDELSRRIAALSADSIARMAFYRRLNFYRAFKANPKEMHETYSPLYLPQEHNPKENSGTGTKPIQVLSHDKPNIMQEDWTAYNDYVASYGDDATLTAQWKGCGNNAPAGTDYNPLVSAKVETIPVFPGGDMQLFKFIQLQLEYPLMERDNDISGKVLTRFVVCPDGTVSQGEIVKGVSPGLDRESMLVLKMMPRFKPGTQDGKTVSVYFNLPIVFKLQ